MSLQQRTISFPKIILKLPVIFSKLLLNDSTNDIYETDEVRTKTAEETIGTNDLIKFIKILILKSFIINLIKILKRLKTI